MPRASAACAEGKLPPASVPLGRFMGSQPGLLRIERRRLVLEFRSSGRLVPWIGPAIRGITALRYRAAVCQQPREEWTGRWRQCRGCPHVSSCGYGTAFEPESPSQKMAAASTADDDMTDIGSPPAGPPSSSIDAVRPIVISPAFPAPVVARRGMSLAVQITSVGADAAATTPSIIKALVNAGLHDGLGPDRVRFVLDDLRSPVDAIVVDPLRLPPLAADGPTLRRLKIRLDSPLFLRERDARQRRTILDPGFDTFVRHSVRIIRQFFPTIPHDRYEHGEEVAAGVVALDDDLRPFHQEKASRRTFRRFDLEGITGLRTFADVPACFLPWLTLAGVLHVGGHRVAGAGGWTAHEDPTPELAKPR